MNTQIMQIERLLPDTIQAGENVIFDSVLVITGSNSYNSTTGVITFNDPGRYEITWWVATHTTMSTEGVGFALVSSQGNNIVGNSPIKTGEVVGVGVIEVTTVPITVELKNNSSTAIFCSPAVPVKASLAIIGVDNTAPVLPQGSFASLDAVTIAPGDIVPMTIESSTNTPGAFSLAVDGRINILNSGIYLADARLQLAPRSSGIIALQKNDEGAAVPYYNAGSFDAADSNASGIIVVNNILILNAGDTVSIVNVPDPQFTIELLGPLNNTGSPVITPTAVVRLVYLAAP